MNKQFCSILTYDTFLHFCAGNLIISYRCIIYVERLLVFIIVNETHNETTGKAKIYLLFTLNAY